MREPTKAADATPTPTHIADGNAAGGKASKVASTEDRTRFELLRCAMYHEDCEASFAFWHRAFTGLNVLLGTAAVGTVLGERADLTVMSGVAVAVLSVLSLVWDYAGRARDHKVLRQRYFQLLGEFESGAASAERVTSAMSMIYADEPPAKSRVSAVAHNRAGELMWGDGFDRVPVSRFARWSRHLLR